MIELRIPREGHELHTPAGESLPVHAAGKRIGSATVLDDGTLQLDIDVHEYAEALLSSPLQTPIEQLGELLQDSIERRD